MMDPRDQQDVLSALPLNLEAEHALLGILMYDNAAHRQVHDLITPEDFSEPFHQRLYGAVVEKILAGKLAEPTTLQTLDADPAYVEFGGIVYLLDLVDHAPPTSRVRDYAEQIADTAVRRRLIKMAAEAQSQARNPDVTGYAAVAMARAQLEEAERGAAPEDALFVNAWDAAQARMDRLELEVATGKPKGVQTGLSSIDKRLGGLLPGSVIVMAGRPGMGKTALLGNVLYGAALRNPGKLFAGFSLEMDTDQLNDRALSRLAELDRGSHRTGAEDRHRLVGAAPSPGPAGRRTLAPLDPRVPPEPLLAQGRRRPGPWRARLPRPAGHPRRVRVQPGCGKRHPQA